MSWEEEFDKDNNKIKNEINNIIDRINKLITKTENLKISVTDNIKRDYKLTKLESIKYFLQESLN